MINYQNMYIKHEPELALYAIIILDNLKKGPALGGCRFINYSSVESALSDAVRLARGMSYKAVSCGLSYGGGKAVILKPQQNINYEKFFKSFAELVNSLEGKYITTVDSGLTSHDLNTIARYTPYVTGHAKYGEPAAENPAPYTAAGVIKGMQAAVKFKLNRDSLAGLHIVMQGVGQVGFELVKALITQGAKVSISDVNASAVKKCAEEFTVNIIPPAEIYNIPCDIFSPCGLGGTLNNQTIPLLDTAIVAGCANNQLFDQECGEMLAKKNILYVPDYIINAGGLIKVAGQYEETPLAIINARIGDIYQTAWRIFQRSITDKITTNIAADLLAQRLLNT